MGVIRSLKHQVLNTALSTLCVCLSTMLAPSAHADDLMTVYRKAQSRDAVFEAARYMVEAAQEKLPQARANLLPTVSLNANGSRQKGNVSFSDAPYADREVRSNGTTLQLSQPRYRRANWLAYEQADAQVRQAIAQFSQAEQDLILRVSQSYLDVLVAQESLSVASFQLKAVEQQLELARRNYQVGTATVTDVHEAKSRFDLSRAQRIGAMNDLEVKNAELEKLLGDAPMKLASLRKDVELPGIEPAELDAWLAQARNQYPLVRVQEAAHEIAERELARNQAMHLPTLDLTASYGKSYTSGSVSSPADVATRNNIGQIGVQLSIPLYAGGGVNSRVREAVANLGKATAELDGARRQAAALARQAYAGIANGQAQTAALVSAVESSKSSVEANKIGYRIGTRINIDVLNAEQQLYAAQRDLAKSKAETLMSGLRLKAATGSLQEADVHALNRLLETPTE
jgi:outer membrane protein